MDDDSDIEDRRRRYRCIKEEECSRCEERYRNDDQRKQSRDGGSIWYNDMSRCDFSGVFINKEHSTGSTDIGQVVIVDSGCPRSLMGDHQLDRLKDIIDVKICKVKEEGFRFGPSKTYRSNKKAKFSMRIGIHEVDCEFFLINGNIPILLGNDIMVPYSGNINMEENTLYLNKVDMEIPLKMTKGGHFVIPVRSIAGLDRNNVKGEEADAVMLMVLERVDEKAIKTLHDEVGHGIFLALLALTNEEEKHVNKAHRYFGHRSARRIWELFAKANKLKGKKQEVLDVINNCKTCSQHKKAPSRPKVGLPVANTFNEVVGLDLKVLNKTKGEYILWMVDLFSKMIKGKFIRNKKPETIINGILSTWCWSWIS